MERKAAFKRRAEDEPSVTVVTATLVIMVASIGVGAATMRRGEMEHCHRKQRAEQRNNNRFDHRSPNACASWPRATRYRRHKAHVVKDIVQRDSPVTKTFREAVLQRMSDQDLSIRETPQMPVPRQVTFVSQRGRGAPRRGWREEIHLKLLFGNSTRSGFAFIRSSISLIKRVLVRPASFGGTR